MELLEKYVSKIEYDSYEDFAANFALKIPDKFDFARDIVDGWAQAEPEKLALLYCDDNGFERRFTFTDISDLSKRAAAYFLSLGIRAGDRVLTLLRRRYEYWICAVALHRIGAVVVPVSIQMETKDLVYRLNKSNAKMILAINDEFVLRQIGGIGDKCPSLREIALISDTPVEKPFRDFDREFVACDPYEGACNLDNEDEFVIYFTSGTSGFPKMAVHNRTYPLGHIITAKYMQCVRNNGLHITQADSGWAKFGWGNIYGQWISGTAILAYDPIRFDAKRMMATLEKYRPTTMCVPPTIYRFLLRDGLEKKHVESIQWFTTAGEPLAGEINEDFHDRFGHYIHEGYGQSEGTPITCTWQWIKVRPASMGKPSPLYDVCIVDADGNNLPQGERGEVVMRIHGFQVGLLSHYVDDNGIIDPVQDGIYHTGDVAYQDENGYYWYVGRNDDVIKSSGYRIGPFEIESILNTHPAVHECAIIGLPDPMRGQVVCAVIALRDGYSPSDELTLELQKYVKSNTAPYKYPRIIRYVDALPKTTSGKIIRSVLKKA